MKVLRDKVAVVTGAANGMGRAVSAALAEQGMHVVLADAIEADLEAATEELARRGHSVLAVPTDVSDGDSVGALAARTLETFGGVHVVHNNAGVVLWEKAWEYSEQDWRWLLGVNLWGVIHGVRTFVPLMLGAGDEGHIINTAGASGLTSPPGLAAYNVTHHGIVALSESLARDLERDHARIKVSVLCPGGVSTRLGETSRYHRSRAMPGDEDRGIGRARPQGGMDSPWFKDPVEIASRVVDAVLTERFYILTHDDSLKAVTERFEAIRRDA